VNDSEGAVVFGIGLGLNYGFSQHVAIDPAIKFSKGKINTGPGTDVGITGLEFSGGLAFTF
jgi:opacity protein-like surface antigen